LFSLCNSIVKAMASNFVPVGPQILPPWNRANREA
jgi:hypothetical protein